MNIKYLRADYEKLENLSSDMFKRNSTSFTTKMFNVIKIGNWGYTKWDKRIEDLANFDIEVFDNTFSLSGDECGSMMVLIDMSFHSKHPRNLNTAVDVYFTFEDNIYGVRFQDWNIFRTLTDEQCEEKLRKYLIDNNEIKHPAKPI